MASASRKIVIIGGGIAGLCAGVYARSCGYEVEIVEQHSVPGGLATSWRRGDYTFETCLHWLVGSKPQGTLNAQWREVFDIDKLDFVYHEEYERLEDKQGRSLSVYADVDRMEAEFLRHAPQDAEEIKAFTAAIRRLSDFPMEDLNAALPRKALAFLRLLPKLPMLQHWSAISARDYGQRFKDDMLRRFFADGASSGMSAIALLFMFAWMKNGNAGYPVGGAKAVIDPIAERFRALGGELRLSTKVEKILVENDVAIGVQLAGGEKILADWVISAADGHATIYDLLGGAYKDEAIDRFYETQEVFPSYVQVSLGVAQDMADEPGFLLSILDEALTIDPQTEFDSVSFRIFHYDPTFAPPGKTAVTCFLPTFNFTYWRDLQREDKARYDFEKRRIADAVVSILEKHSPGLRKSIETIDISTPASVFHFTGNWKGSMEGFLPTPGTGFGSRRQTLPGLGRFLMAGQWVQPGGGLPSGLMTGRAAIQTICRKDHTPFTPLKAERADEKAA